MSENRKRDKVLSVRLTRTEKEILTARARHAKMTYADFILRACFYADINVPPDLTPLLVEVKRIGNNLNQIAAKVNTGVFKSANFDEVISQMSKIYEQLLRIGRSE